MFSKKHYIWFIAITVAALLVFASVAYAGFVTIDTNNGTEDNWNNVPMLADDGGDVSHNLDIDKVWVGNDAADPSEVYFRVDLNPGPLLQYDSLEARLDCTTPPDGDWEDAEDIVVYYYFGATEEVTECQGNAYASGCTSGTVEPNGAAFGEEIEGATMPYTYTYEWKADVSKGVSGEVDWTECLSGTGVIQVQFASYNDLTEIDTTPWTSGQGAYSIPNSVTLKSFAAQNQVPIAAVAVGAAAVGGLLVIRRRKGH